MALAERSWHLLQVVHALIGLRKGSLDLAFFRAQAGDLSSRLACSSAHLELCLGAALWHQAHVEVHAPVSGCTCCHAQQLLAAHEVCLAGGQLLVLARYVLLQLLHLLLEAGSVLAGRGPCTRRVQPDLLPEWKSSVRSLSRGKLKYLALACLAAPEGCAQQCLAAA